MKYTDFEELGEMLAKGTNVKANIVPVVDEGDEDVLLNDDNIEDELAVLPVMDQVLFPGVLIPIAARRAKSRQLLEEVNGTSRHIAVFTQKGSEEDPTELDLYPVGVVAKVLRMLEMPDNTTTVILQGFRRVKLLKVTQHDPYLKGRVAPLNDIMLPKNDKETRPLLEAIKDVAIKFIRLSEIVPPDSAFAIKNITSSLFLVNFLCAHLPIQIEEKMELLMIDSMKDRAYRLLGLMNREVQLAEIKASIQMRAREDIDQQQREYFLQQQIKTIQDELGGNGSRREIEEMRRKANTIKWNEEVKNTFLKEVDKLEQMHQQSPEYSMQLDYLKTMMGLPWGIYTTDNLNIQNAERVLNRDHYGLERVKERILEHLAVLKLKGDMKSPIICLYGPPGVGKTSLGKSIATALKRKYIRMSLGGVHDEAEIRGHRKTYIGAMPGRIIKGMMKAGSSNPVIVLDEVDKLGNDMHGDPSSALLEVLDPEQNATFHDNYLDVDYDLSKVMFIATANNLQTIPQPLLDRMELIELSGYLTEEKIEIARKHLVPKQLEANGMKKGEVRFPKATLEAIIENYTRESGVRELEKKIGKVLRKMAYQYAKDGSLAKTEVKPADLRGYLGVQEYSRDKYQGNDYAGVVTGLAWTAVGGEILFIETSLNHGKGKLTLTGSLGDVMKESAMLAVEYIKAHPAVPKDGPSAGITMATSLASALTQRKVKANLAMTGEITLRGKVLPVGGIKEKILAAKRAGIKEIILSEANRKNIEDIQPIYIEGLTFHFVKDVKEVFDLALLKEKVADAIDLTVVEDNKKKEE